MKDSFKPPTRKTSISASFTGWIVRHMQQCIGSLGNMWRTPFTSIMTILVLGISLTLPATLHLFVNNAKVVTGQWNSASDITLFLKISVNEKSAQQMAQRISLYPEIKSVKYISANDALKEFKLLSGLGEAIDYLDDNPLPATILITPTKHHSQPEAANNLLLKLEQEREVDQGKLDLEWLTRLQAIAKLIEDVVLGLAFLLCLSVVLIIGNTIRLAILNQRDAIAVMKLVGATDAFIQRPFLYSGVWYGVLGGIVSCSCVWLFTWYLSDALVTLTDLYHSHFVLTGLSLLESLLLIFIAVFLGFSGSYISVRKHIKEIEPTAD